MTQIDYFRRLPEYPRRRPLRRLWTDIGMTLGGPLLVWLLALLIGSVLTAAWAYCSPLMSLGILIALALMARNVRRSRAMLVVNYVEQAVRLNLPVPAMLSAAQESERGTTAKRIGRLRDNLEAGFPLGAALQASVPGLPARVLGLIRAAEQIGGLPSALRRIVQQEQAVVDRQPAQSIMLRWYPILILLCVGPIYWFILIFVFPKFKQIFMEFGLPLPAATVWMIDFWDLLQVPIAALAVVVLAVISGRMLWELIPRGSTSFSPFRAITDRLAWFIPPWRTVARSRGFADVCHVLAEAADAGQPLDRALAEAAEACANRVLELRVRQWSQRVSAGVSMSDAARQAKMPTLLVGMLSTAQGPGGIQDVLRFLLRYYDSRYSTAMALLNGAAIPLMVVLLAFFVLTAALGLFMPLVELMNHVGGAKGVM